ncbi:MAG TPA: CHC2 zinc finger domain-containing protein, partial [Syntrophomonas sp.]|nr:CHC2 zinc finger domain-containing protein [Syntrophomonas sp.]
MIDHSTIERIFDAAQITDVVSEFVSLKRRGVNLLGLCPFHNEKTPSFTVSPAKGIFKCFGCGKGGNAVNFIMEHEHLSYPEALRWLAKKYHIEIEEKEVTPEELAKQNERES